MNKLNIKAICLILFLLFVTVTATMAMELEFSSWNFITQTSPDIIIARCSRTPDPEKDRGFGSTGNMSYSDIEVISILKGVTNAWSNELPKLGASRLAARYWPRQGEYYLTFSIYAYGKYQANEKYRIVPLGSSFDTNILSGKTLDQQIQTLLQRRLDDLNRQMKLEQEEKARLETGIKK